MQKGDIKKANIEEQTALRKRRNDKVEKIKNTREKTLNLLRERAHKQPVTNDIARKLAAVSAHLDTITDDKVIFANKHDIFGKEFTCLKYCVQHVLTDIHALLILNRVAASTEPESADLIKFFWGPFFSQVCANTIPESDSHGWILLETLYNCWLGVPQTFGLDKDIAVLTWINRMMDYLEKMVSTAPGDYIETVMSLGGLVAIYTADRYYEVWSAEFVLRVFCFIISIIESPKFRKSGTGFIYLAVGTLEQCCRAERFRTLCLFEKIAYHDPPVMMSPAKRIFSALDNAFNVILKFQLQDLHFGRAMDSIGRVVTRTMSKMDVPCRQLFDETGWTKNMRKILMTTHDDRSWQLYKNGLSMLANYIYENGPAAKSCVDLLNTCLLANLRSPKLEKRVQIVHVMTYFVNAAVLSGDYAFGIKLLQEYGILHLVAALMVNLMGFEKEMVDMLHSIELLLVENIPLVTGLINLSGLRDKLEEHCLPSEFQGLYEQANRILHILETGAPIEEDTAVEMTDLKPAQSATGFQFGNNSFSLK